jgi:RHS repeat-associated protein
MMVEAITNRLAARAYDTQGNETGDANGVTVPVDQYAYDALNNLKTEKNGNVTFLYTATDERIAIIQNPGPAETITWTVRDLTGMIVRDFTQTSAGAIPGTDYVYRDGLLAATVNGTTVRRFHLDYLGTPRLITDGGGVIKVFHHYYGFGEESAATKGGENARLRFTGNERDDLAALPENLDYLHARYYAPSERRFLSLDPVLGSSQDPQSWNRYGYVHNSPINFIDPLGLYSETITVTGPPVPGPTRHQQEVREWELLNRELDRELERASAGAERIRSIICRAIPTGRTLGGSYSMGSLTSGVTGVELVLNYDSGQVSAFGFGGAQAIWNGVISANAYSGMIYGLQSDNDNYKGGFSGFAAGGTYGVFVARSSGGLTHGWRNLWPRGAVKAVGLTVGKSLVGAGTVEVSSTEYTDPLQLGKYWGFGTSPGDWLLYAARQVCR